MESTYGVYVEERRGEWYLYFSVSRSMGLMLADKSVQERMTGTELEACGRSHGIWAGSGRENAGHAGVRDENDMSIFTHLPPAACMVMPEVRAD